MNFDGVMNDKVCGVLSTVELLICPQKQSAARTAHSLGLQVMEHPLARGW
jgi:hypothetical protein